MILSLKPDCPYWMPPLEQSAGMGSACAGGTSIVRCCVYHSRQCACATYRIRTSVPSFPCSLPPIHSSAVPSCTFMYESTDFKIPEHANFMTRARRLDTAHAMTKKKKEEEMVRSRNTHREVFHARLGPCGCAHPRVPRYSMPHFRRTITGFPVRLARKGFGLTSSMSMMQTEVAEAARTR